MVCSEFSAVVQCTNFSLSTHLFLHDNLLKLAVGGRDQLVVGKSLALQEDVEHQRNALEAQQVISAISLSPGSSSIHLGLVLAYRLAGISILSCEGFLHAVDDRAILICGLRFLSRHSLISRISQDWYIFIKLNACSTVLAYHAPQSFLCRQDPPNSKHSSSNSSVVYL